MHLGNRGFLSVCQRRTAQGCVPVSIDGAKESLSSFPCSYCLHMNPDDASSQNKAPGLVQREERERSRRSLGILTPNSLPRFWPRAIA